ncbi:hypothetical protein DL98DRAFT_594715 [Cadophora sp. DSE1049]|nr:hypothetical protein DL98DRAFT_594715 [Cadophora sp. DSE1049]
MGMLHILGQAGEPTEPDNTRGWHNHWKLDPKRNNPEDYELFPPILRNHWLSSKALRFEGLTRVPENDLGKHDRFKKRSKLTSEQSPRLRAAPESTVERIRKDARDLEDSPDTDESRFDQPTTTRSYILTAMILICRKDPPTSSTPDDNFVRSAFHNAKVTTYKYTKPCRKRTKFCPRTNPSNKGIVSVTGPTRSTLIRTDCNSHR